MSVNRRVGSFTRRVVVVAVASVCAAGTLAASAVAAPSSESRGCQKVTALYEGGNPGIATAAATPGGYGPCGTGTPPGRG